MKLDSNLIFRNWAFGEGHGNIRGGQHGGHSYEIFHHDNLLLLEKSQAYQSTLTRFTGSGFFFDCTLHTWRSYLKSRQRQMPYSTDLTDLV